MFLSFHHADGDEVVTFLERFGGAVDRALSLGVSDADRPFPMGDSSRLLDRISRRYLGEATMTLVLIGATTWRRRYVDWEIAATFHGAPKRAVLGVQLASASTRTPVPPRLAAAGRHAAVRPHPHSAEELRGWITDAHEEQSGLPRAREVHDLLRQDLPRPLR